MLLRCDSQVWSSDSIVSYIIEIEKERQGGLLTNTQASHRKGAGVRVRLNIPKRGNVRLSKMTSPGETPLSGTFSP